MIYSAPHQRKAKSEPMFTAAKMLADTETVALRLLVCRDCEKNVDGVCKACCGGVPVPNLVQIRVTKCKAGNW